MASTGLAPKLSEELAWYRHLWKFDNLERLSPSPNLAHSPRAPLRVHVTQAAISMQIRQLENELGAKLFIRAPRRVMLTEAGEQLLQRARQILRDHDAAVDEIAELAGAERGRLRIGSASAMVTTDVLPKL